LEHVSFSESAFLGFGLAFLADHHIRDFAVIVVAWLDVVLFALATDENGARLSATQLRAPPTPCRV
jgi:hypothetical protein